MAYFFGEIIELSSRAVSDEEIEKLSKCVLKLEVINKQVSFRSCKLAIFSVGKSPSAFVKSYFLNDKAVPIAQVKSIRELTTDDSFEFYNGLNKDKFPSGMPVASMHLIKEDTLICEIQPNIVEEMCSQLCSLLLEHFDFEFAVILATSHAALFKSESRAPMLQPHFMKYLATSRYLADYSCHLEKLPPPNFVSKFPAALLTECEIKKKPALCIINFSDTSENNLSNVEAFRTVLDLPLFSGMPINVDADSNLARFIKQASFFESNLYA